MGWGWLEDAWEDVKGGFEDVGDWIEGAAKDGAGFLGANVADSIPVIGQLNALVGVIDSFTDGDNFLNEGDPNRIPPELKSIVLPPKPVKPQAGSRVGPTGWPESSKDKAKRFVQYEKDMVVYETLVEAKKNVDALLQEMRNKVVEYRDKGYVDDDDQNVAEKFGSALTGRISRGVLPLKAALALAREHIPMFAEQMDAYQDLFDTGKGSLEALDSWIADNDIPALSQVREIFASKLAAYKEAIRAIPGGETIASTVLGKDLDDANLLDFADTAATFANPAYAVARSAMTLNKSLKDSLERKGELSQQEFLQLFQHYLMEEVERLGLDGAQFTDSELDQLGETVVNTPDAVPMAMLNTSSFVKRPGESIDEPVRIEGRLMGDVNGGVSAVVSNRPVVASQSALPPGRVPSLPIAPPQNYSCAF